MGDLVMSCNIRQTKGGLMSGILRLQVPKRCTDAALQTCVASKLIVLRAKPTSTQKRSGELCIQAMSAALYSVGQSCCSILSHDTFHHCFSSNNSLENNDIEARHLSCYFRSYKNTLYF